MVRRKKKLYWKPQSANLFHKEFISMGFTPLWAFHIKFLVFLCFQVYSFFLDCHTLLQCKSTPTDITNDAELNYYQGVNT